MPHLIWRSRMSVGVDSIDQDHRQLIGCLNDLDMAINAPDFDGKRAARTLLQLIAYTRDHFAREEQLMQAVGYPDFETHRKQHDVARRALDEISKEFLQQPGKKTADRIYDFTADWLVQHIILADTKIGPFVQGAAAKAAQGAAFPTAD